VNGTYRRRNGRWYLQIYDGLDPATGKERRKEIALGTTSEREAHKRGRRHLSRSDRGERDPEKVSFGEYLTMRWLPSQKGRLRPSSYASYEQLIRSHILPVIGAIPLHKLSAEDLDGLYTQLSESHRPKTIRNIHGVLRKALADAERKESVLRNVADLADPPKLSSRRRAETRIWTASQLGASLSQMESHRLHPAYFLASHTGLRRGEVLGLQWKDVDLDAGRLSVRRALGSVGYKITISDVKTDHGRRNVDMDERTVTILRTWRARQLEERLAVGSRFQDHGLVFSRPEGTAIHPDYLSQTFDRAVARSGLPVIRLHDLRHTHASILLAAGVPVKVVSERLGHSTPAFTMSVYQHVIPGHGR
jgi:integrase